MASRLDGAQQLLPAETIASIDRYTRIELWGLRGRPQCGPTTTEPAP
ncbi:hypothetical protein [Synechococcus sp. RS9916]|nr:hypothetical protein [Synechococcus sp. RS9916]EAU75534.1 hypothetical protein RS9916_38542 [Synechococcus sp. RS9916]